ncbi:Zn(2)-C6 fungal-type domain-containing protein [Favolaschia claudopus]|uniref:Zn(2)-C6 fungal-type domain-containing protein n=1 Tax=Favolaschia claudopus TaxID=2862362 RepID=A0AAW0E5Z9_9AGAR
MPLPTSKMAPLLAPTDSLNRKIRKPPACNPCKARRVLCHPQPGGAPCPRCAEKEIKCTTTLPTRGKQLKSRVQTRQQHLTAPSLVLHCQPNFESSDACPQLTPEFVAHCFEGFVHDAFSLHPLIMATTIASDLRNVSYQLELLPQSTRILAFCSIAYGSFCSFHESILGDGLRPQCFHDAAFFSSNPELLGCGVRRIKACHALRFQALKNAWMARIIISQPSTENAAACYILDALEQIDETPTSNRPWATAYLAHLRALIPVWRTPSCPPNPPWEGAAGFTFLMFDALSSARVRKPVQITHQDQLLLSGAAPSLETLLCNLNQPQSNANIDIVLSTATTYMFHVTVLARELVDEITGEVARAKPLSAAVVLAFLDRLSTMHLLATLILDRLDLCIAQDLPTSVNESTALPGWCAVKAGFLVCFGFSSLTLTLYDELKYRDTYDQDWNLATKTFFARAHELATFGAKKIARGIRYLPKVHYAPSKYELFRAWADFFVEQADCERTAGRLPICIGFAHDILTLTDELKLLGYSLPGASSPDTFAVIERLENYANSSLSSLFLAETVHQEEI